jgi:GT2 family glycosyltransferase
LAYNINKLVPYYHTQTFICILFPLIFRNIFDRLAHIKNNLNKIKLVKVGRFHGCAFAFRAEYFHELDLFDDGTFLYGEEIISSIVIKRSGHLIHLAKNIHIRHQEKIEPPTLTLNKQMVNSYSYIFMKYFKIQRNIANYLAEFSCLQLRTSSIILSQFKKYFIKS